MMAVFAEYEAKRISERTKDALKAAKARGVVLGAAGAANLKPNIEARQQATDLFARKLSGVIEGMKARGLTQRAMADELNGRWRVVADPASARDGSRRLTKQKRSTGSNYDDHYANQPELAA
ncbi:resolvase [Caballeronia glebae]|uniref:Resolvase n=1 Tax=Caballeronia glebae TaxID=1777143 RepID=A0A158DQ66_9BURK|nr:recombinase family protein [Caballeronia glebae]SAK96748.1 resolvase [Caballeronia glebae]